MADESYTKWMINLIKSNTSSSTSDHPEMPTEFVASILDTENRIQQRTIPRSFFATELDSYS